MDWSLLTKQYLQRVPVSVLVQNVNLSKHQLDEVWQTTFLTCTVNHPLSLKYPPSLSHRRMLIKTVVKEVERQEHEVIDELVEVLGLAMAASTSGSGYITYLLGNMFVSILESELLVSDGTTGLHTWSASLRLAEYFMDNPELLAGKRVLELGSGVGLMGLLLSSVCLPASYTFTDGHHSVLNKLASNISINHNSCSNLQCATSMKTTTNPGNDVDVDDDDDDDDEERTESDVVIETGSHSNVEWHWSPWKCVGCGNVVCEKEERQLDWECVSKVDLEKSHYDVILAADVICDKDIHFLNALRQLYDVTNHVTAYVANPVRRPDSMKAFLDGIDALKLTKVEVEMPGSRSLHWPRDHVHVMHVITAHDER